MLDGDGTDVKCCVALEVLDLGFFDNCPDMSVGVEGRLDGDGTTAELGTSVLFREVEREIAGSMFSAQDVEAAGTGLAAGMI